MTDISAKTATLGLTHAYICTVSIISTTTVVTTAIFLYQLGVELTHTVMHPKARALTQFKHAVTDSKAFFKNTDLFCLILSSYQCMI